MIRNPHCTSEKEHTNFGHWPCTPFTQTLFEMFIKKGNQSGNKKWTQKSFESLKKTEDHINYSTPKTE